MKIAVAGLWHLGLVTAACLASSGHEVVALADDPEVAANLQAGHLPISEPGLLEAIEAATQTATLRFSSDIRNCAAADIVWITYDTPVDDDDRADVPFVLERVKALLPHLGPHALVLISSQLPVGSTRTLEVAYRDAVPAGTATFAYSPENLRLGQAMTSFTKAERVIVGTRGDVGQHRLAEIFQPYTRQLVWMGVESAEMTKHAINAWLATSVAFINEIAVLCEQVGADAGDVARGLLSEPRIGPRAYLRPGGAFAGGTLARDIAFLADLARERGVTLELAPAVRRSNDAHRRWMRQRLVSLVPDLQGKKIALLGLTYKPGTNTLRRSSAVEIGRWLAEQGAGVAAWDPAIETLPGDLSGLIALQRAPQAALTGASAALVATDWPEFRTITAEQVLAWMAVPLVLDPGRYLEQTMTSDQRIHYVSVGRSA